jgi:hypothetical protein
LPTHQITLGDSVSLFGIRIEQDNISLDTSSSRQTEQVGIEALFEFHLKRYSLNYDIAVLAPPEEECKAAYRFLNASYQNSNSRETSSIRHYNKYPSISSPNNIRKERFSIRVVVPIFPSASTILQSIKKANIPNLPYFYQHKSNAVGYYLESNCVYGQQTMTFEGTLESLVIGCRVVEKVTPIRQFSFRIEAPTEETFTKLFNMLSTLSCDMKTGSIYLLGKEMKEATALVQDLQSEVNDRYPNVIRSLNDIGPRLL